jgi:hypothetical protein
MTDDLIKTGYTITVSAETLRDVQQMNGFFRALMGPDTRTPEQKAADKAARAVVVDRMRAETAAAHIALCKQAGQFRQILKLHAPAYSHDTQAYAHCDGCDAGSNAEDSPSFPCRTYELIESMITGVPVEEA